MKVQLVWAHRGVFPGLSSPTQCQVLGLHSGAESRGAVRPMPAFRMVPVTSAPRILLGVGRRRGSKQG